jgi:hypothetical protein
MYATVMRARIEYEISDSSRDGPNAHRKMMARMEALQKEADRQIADDATRRPRIIEAAQRGRLALIEELTGAMSDSAFDEWLEGR